MDLGVLNGMVQSGREGGRGGRFGPFKREGETGSQRERGERGMDGWMNSVLGHFYALSRLHWAGDNLG